MRVPLAGGSPEAGEMSAHAHALKNASIARKPIQNRSDSLPASAITGIFPDGPDAVDQQEVAHPKRALLLLPERARGRGLHADDQRASRQAPALSPPPAVASADASSRPSLAIGGIQGRVE